MQDVRSTAWIVFNGQIYNYKDLRVELEMKGIKFRTKSDTEVLVNFVSAYGAKLLHKLNGMFGFAYYDPETDYCLLARDYLGIKLVYYCEVNGYVAFDSEIKSLFTLPWIKFRIEESLLEELLTFRFIAGRNALFKDIFKLEPGEYLEIKNGTIQKDKFWDLPRDNNYQEVSIENAVKTFDSYFCTSVEKQLVADVPVGTFLSGGVDSSIVTAISSLKKNNDRLKTFVVGFDSPEWDERPYALKTSKKYNTDHYEYIMTPDRFLESIKKLTYYNDEPISHPNSIPLYHLSKIAREKVTVVLTGEGADEMLSGYPRHQVVKLRDKAELVPVFLRNILGNVLCNFPNRKIKMVGNGILFDSDEDALIFNSQFVPNRLVNNVLLKDIPGEGLTHRRKYANYFKDYKLVEWIMNLHPNLKIRGKTGKFILKRLAEQYIDYDIIYRPKSGFGLPLSEWFRDKNALKPFLNELASGNFYPKEYFDQRAINLIVKEHLSCHNDHSELL
jgi:asparagine synthase (glutamine-hydrolysing)